jgi:hypothetical protein
MDMTRALPIALIALALSVGASFAVPPEACVDNAMSSIDHHSLSQYTLADPANVTGGARNHSCSTIFVTGVMLTTAGQVLGFPALTAIGMYLTFQSTTICI